MNRAVARAPAIMTSLQKELDTLGVTKGDLAMHGDGRRALARAQAAQILTQKFSQRDKVKAKLGDEQVARREIRFQERQRKIAQWQQKTRDSPFLVDLVAEDERIAEENKVRIEDELRQQRMLANRRTAAKREIVLKALQEDSDLDALRREKRAIMEEEKRLKALLDIEKTNSHAKADLLVAQRAERQRKTAQADYRRRENLSMLVKQREMDRTLLKEKHCVGAAPPNTFTSYGN